MPLRTFVVDSDAAFRSQLRAELQDIANTELVGEGDSLVAARDLIAGGDVDLLVFEIGRGNDGALDQVARWKAERPALVVYACSSTRSADTLLAAMRAGVSEWLDKPLDTNAFAEALRRAAQAASSAASESARPRTTCVFSLKGGQGVTTVAVNMAVSLAAQAGTPCALLDLSFGLGDAAGFLDLQPQYTFTNLIGPAEHADLSRLQSCLLRHSSGAYYLGEKESLDEPSAITPEQLREALTHLQTSFSDVIVDAGHVADSHTLEVFAGADTILLVSTCEVLSVRSTKYALRLLHSLGFGHSKIRVVLNRVTRQNAVTPAQFAETVAHPVEATIPDDYRAVAESVNAGDPLVLSRPKSPVAKVITELAQRLHGAAGEAKTSK